MNNIENIFRRLNTHIKPSSKSNRTHVCVISRDVRLIHPQCVVHIFNRVFLKPSRNKSGKDERKRRWGTKGTRFNSDLISCLGHVFSWKRPEGAHVRWETVCLSRAKRVSGTTRARHESSWVVRVPR